MNLLEPWLLLRLAAGVFASLLFARGAVVALRVIRHFDVSRATEGQLALEHQAELSSTFVRVASVVQVGLLLLTVLAADRLSRAVRGAMCADGVFQANEWGARSLAVTAMVALGAGILSRLYTLDARVRGLELVRPLAIATVALAPWAVVDLIVTALFLAKLDLGVTSSCCSLQLDGPVAANVYASGPRVLTAVLAPVAVGLSASVALLASRHPRPRLVALAGALSLAALPIVLGATVLEVAPHVFESPSHLCPFCLFKREALFVGYPLFAAMLFAVISAVGAGVGALLTAGRESSLAAFDLFAGRSLRQSAYAWLVAFAIGLAPIVRYSILSGGASLFR